MKDPEHSDDPPMSGTDEEEADDEDVRPGPSAAVRAPSSDDDSPQRGRIQPTSFTASKSKLSKSSNKHGPANTTRFEDAIPSQKRSAPTPSRTSARVATRQDAHSFQSKRPSVNDPSEPESGRPPKRARPDSPASNSTRGDHLDKSTDWIKRISTSAPGTKSTRPKTTFGASGKSYGTKETRPRKSPVQPSVERKSRNTDSPLGFPESPRGTLKKTRSSPLPLNATPTRSFKTFDAVGSVSPIKPFVLPPALAKLDGTKSKRGATKPTAVKKSKRSKTKQEEPPRRVRRNSAEGSQRPIFKTLDIGPYCADVDLGNSPVELSGDGIPLTVDDDGSLSPLTDLDELLSDKAICPMCRAKVDKDLLETFTKNRHMTITQQQRFCDSHKRKTARENWIAKGYPQIDWLSMDERIEKQYAVLRKILDGAPSHYASIFGQKIKEGKDRTLLKSTNSLTPGYYGTRGLRMMSDNIVKEFSSLLRKQAIKDRLVSARGHTAYVQAVLVPELTVRLIMEDMDVKEGEARSILEDSVSVGELLNEEVEDVVLQDDDTDGSSLSLPPSEDEDDDAVEID